MTAIRLFLVTSLVAFIACTDAPSDSPTGMPPLDDAERNALVAEAGAPLFDGMGNLHHPITASHEGSQRYFNQGLAISYAFNHAEAVRSFQAAQRLDDDCAMCFWGEALATGPNINVTSNGKAIMSAEERVRAFAALQKALARKDKASEVISLRLEDVTEKIAA